MDALTEHRRLRSELAGLRVLAALARLELKYRADQARVPRGQPGGGRFADEHGGGRMHPGFLAPAAAAARAATRASPALAEAGGAEAAAALAPAAGAVAAGMVGVSRAAGLATQAANGGGVTPILHVPFQIDMPGRTVATKPGGVTITPQIESQCYKAYDEDISACYRALGLKRGDFHPGNALVERCLANAADRYADCRRTGQPYNSSIPLFAGVNTGHEHEIIRAEGLLS